MDDLLELMARLRDSQQGCPWDLEQTMASLLPYTLEECYEVVDAVERQATGDICDELGDLLFQVVFYSRIAEEAGWFDFERVAAGIVDKLRRRHPHVFGDAVIRTAAEQRDAWDQHKAQERKRRAKAVPQGYSTALAGVAQALPALTRAIKLQRRAAQVGFDWRAIPEVLAKVEEELEELRVELPAGDAERLTHEVGDLLLAASNLARHVGVDPETALRRANRRFEQRFAAMERMADENGQTLAALTPADLEALWVRAKAAEAQSGG